MEQYKHTERTLLSKYSRNHCRVCTSDIGNSLVTRLKNLQLDMSREKGNEQQEFCVDAILRKIHHFKISCHEELIAVPTFLRKWLETHDQVNKNLITQCSSILFKNIVISLLH